MSTIKQLLAMSVAVLAVGAVSAEESVACRVNLTSQPSGASVVVDGKDRGTTPVMLFDLAPGRHHVKFRLAGYEERDRFVDTREGPFVERNEVLQETKGLLVVKSDPAGATIVVDGVAVGQTPRLVTGLSAKDPHSIKLRKAGYQELPLSVRFDGRTPFVRDEKLVLASGTLNIMSEPAGAEVTVNGIVRGVTPLTVTGVPKGRAVVKFRLEGFAEEERELAVSAGSVDALPVSLKALPGTLHLTSVPDGARFYVNGEAKGKGPVVLPGLKPGDYEVRAELEGFGTETRTVKLENGSSASEEFRLSNTMGRLEVRTSPVGAQVVFDGRLLGTTRSSDPQADVSDVFPIENVLEGEHALVIRADGYAESTRHPKIRSSKTSKANVRLRRVFIPNIEIVTARGSYAGILVANTPEAITIEVSLGITRSFPRDEIRDVKFLTPESPKK